MGYALDYRINYSSLWKTLIALLITAITVFGCGTANSATKLPGEAEKLLPMLVVEINKTWPTIPMREFPAGLYEQEAGWKPNAVLKTKREFGCGLGQMTITYNEDGSVRFDTISDMKKLDSSLNAWSWKDCANIQMQMRASLVKMRTDAKTCFTGMANTNEAMACVAAKYNGGPGSVAKRVRFCRLEAGCDPRYWFENLETQCGMSKKKVAGYGESFCDINSKYPGRIYARKDKYIPYLK